MPEAPQTAAAPKAPTITLQDFQSRYANKTKAAEAGVSQGTTQGHAKPNVFEFMAGTNAPEEAKPDPDAPFADVPPVNDIPTGEHGYGEPSKGSYLQAKMVNKLTEVGLANTAKYVAMADSTKMFRPDEEMTEDLVYLWAVIIEDSDKKIPPGALLALMLLVVWGPIFAQAANVRKLNKERKPRENKPRESETAKAAARAKDGPGTISDAEEVEVEVLFDETELISRLKDTQTRASIAGVPPFATFQQPPKGLCKWFYMVEGKEVTLTKERNQFFSSKEAMRWNNLKKDYERCEIDFPGDWTA